MRGSWRPNRTATYWPPHSSGHNHVSYPFSWAAQPEAWGPTLLGAGFLYRILSTTGLVSKLTDFLSSPSYIIVQRPLLLESVTIALIQPIHGHGYNSDIPRPDAPVIYIVAFSILIARLSRRTIYNSTCTSHGTYFSLHFILFHFFNSPSKYFTFLLINHYLWICL